MFCYFREWKYPSQSGLHPEEDQLSTWSYAWRKRGKSLEHVNLLAQNNLVSQSDLKAIWGVNQGRLPGFNQISLMQQQQKKFIPIKLNFFTWIVWIGIENFHSKFPISTLEFNILMPFILELVCIKNLQRKSWNWVHWKFKF